MNWRPCMFNFETEGSWEWEEEMYTYWKGQAFLKKKLGI